ncbi:MAG: cytochrome c5 [Candidatus Azotimanducaceae bacterium]|jgi:cytochrome c5
MNKRLALLIVIVVMVFGIAGCGGSDQSQGVEPNLLEESPLEEGPDSVRVARLWSQSCALCHVSAVAGAPRSGNADDWAARLATGKPLLLKHTIEGYNNMPPLGYCMACTEADFSALIDLMAGGVTK